MEDARITLKLTAQERQLLAEVLEQDFRDLKQEIGRTEGFDFREGLKARRDTIAAILDKLGAQLA